MSKCKAITIAAALAVLIAAVAGCDAGPKTSDKDIRRVEYATVTAMLADTKVKTVLVDARSPSAYAEEHIAGAINLHLPEITELHPRLRGYTRLIVYSTGQVSDPVGNAAAKRLIAVGYEDVYDYSGGLADWKQQGGATVSGPAPE